MIFLLLVVAKPGWSVNDFMALPKYNELYIPLLAAIADGNIYTMKDVKGRIAQELHLTDEEIAQRLSSDTQTVFNNRLGWAKAYLQKAKLISSPKRAHFQITPEGQKILASHTTITNELLAKHSPDFEAFIKRRNVTSSTSASEPASISVADSTETPQETFDRVYGTINDQLADDLLAEILNQSPAFFENLVVDLMHAMNYGEGFVTKASNDGGVDGIIHEDKLGFNLIYIQAKRWQPDITITKPELQKFAGAMMGPPKIDKGLFITTARFSSGSQQFANAQHIILVDGQRLTQLMIEYGIGISVQKTYTIKRIDSDYFSND